MFCTVAFVLLLNWLGCARAIRDISAADFNGKNVVLFITDQERRVQHYPDGWIEDNMPGTARLMKQGITFSKCYTNSVTCSSSRASMLTGLMPAQHGVRYKLRNTMANDEYPQEDMPTDVANLATIANEAGYTTVYKGKIDVFKGVNNTDANPKDLERYGWSRWNPPDSGLGLGLPEYGYGNSSEADNDERYMSSKALDEQEVEDGLEGAFQYLETVAAEQQPFFLVVSLVNPHDITFFETDNYYVAGYNDSWTEGDVELPPTVNEDLSSKPRAQADFNRISDLVLGELSTPEVQKKYVNFYANLQKWVDQYLVQLLDTLEEQNLSRDTIVIKTSDHGETGLSHGLTRQKCFNFYEETANVPLIISNPVLFPEPRSSDALVSHIDLAPTLQDLLGGKGPKNRFEGISYAPVVFGRETSVQDYIIFTMDDYQIGQSSPPYVDEPNHMLCIREEGFKFCKYFDPAREITKVRSEFEMYDLQKDPSESRNLAYSGYTRTPKEEAQFRRLNRRLKEVSSKRLVARRREHVIDLKANLKEPFADEAQFDLVGNLTGRPIGSGRIYLTNLIDEPGSIKFKIGSGSGIIRGNANLLNTGGDEPNCSITSGTGTYKGIRGNIICSLREDGSAILKGPVIY